MSRNRVQQSRPARTARSKAARGLLTGAALVLMVGGLLGPVGSASAASAASAANVSTFDVDCPLPSASSPSAEIDCAISPVRTALGVRWQ